MKHYFLLLLITLGITSSYSQGKKTDLIIGNWLNYDGTEIIEITRSKNSYTGHIIWLKEPNDKNGNPKLDIKNPNKTLRKKPILGAQKIFGLEYKNGKWQNGRIYSHKRGGTINFEVISISETKLTFKISKFLFSKEITYTRAK